MFRRRGVGRTGAAWMGVAATVAVLCIPAPAGAQAPPPGGQQPPPTRQPLPPGPGPTLRPPPTLAPPTTTAPAAGTEPDGGGGSSGLLPIAVLLAAVAGVAVVVLKTRASPTGATAPVAAPAQAGAALATGPSPVTHELLEVSRQLTAAASRGDVRRAIVRGALSLVPADAAALVATAPHLAIDAESHPGTLLADGLASGVVARVAETGEHIAQVSATEPAVRHLPASLLALPLVSGGRVDSVLVVVRAAELPFGEADVKVLRALVPMAAAALGTERHAQSAIDESLRDPLTGAGNRRRFDQDLTAALTDPVAGLGLALGIIDLDHFKRVNDTHGHPAGDALLRAVVQRAQAALRPGDALYRFGGEEFCFLLGDAPAAEAVAVAERVRAAIAVEPFDVGAGVPLAATASIGVAVAHGPDAAALLAAADAALYEAKQGGRNRVVRAEP